MEDFRIFNIMSLCNAGLLFGSSKNLSNVCIENMGVSGSDYGYIFGSIGTSTPDAVSDGTRFYQLTALATGEFTLSFGDAGNSKLADVRDDQIYLYDDGGTQSDIAIWDDTTTAYIFTNQEWATELIDIINNGDKHICIGMSIVPVLVVHYDFAELKTGV